METQRLEDADGTEEAATLRPDEDVSPVKQSLQEVEGRLLTLSERMTLCTTVLSDLKGLSDALVRKSLQDVSFPPQK